MGSDDFWPNHGSLDWEEILLFDPKTLTAPQHAALKRRERDLIAERYAEHVEGIRGSFTNPPEDEDEFMEKFVDPRE